MPQTESGRPNIRECVLTNILLDLNNIVILWIMAAEGKDLFFSRFDGQRGFIFFRTVDVTDLQWQGWGPRLYENCNATSAWQGNLRNSWRKKEKRSEQDDLFRSPNLLLSPSVGAGRTPSLTPLFPRSWSEKGEG